MRTHKYEAKNGEVTYCKMFLHDDGHWEFDTWPEMVNKVVVDSMCASFDNALARMRTHGLTEIHIKTL